MKQALLSNRWPAITVTVFFIGILGGYLVASSAASTGLLVIALTVVAVMLVVLTKELWALVLMVAFTTPGILGLTSGAYYGMNLKSVFVLLIVTFVASRYFIQRQRPVPTDVLPPVTIFILIQFLSALHGSMINTYQGFSVGWVAKVARDLIAPLSLYLFVVFIQLNEAWLVKLWQAFIGICVLSAANVVFRGLTESSSFSGSYWYDVRLKNLDNPGFFDIFPIVYLLPLNLLIANFIYCRLTHFQKILRIVAGLILLAGAISVLQRAMILCIGVSLFAWLLMAKPLSRKVVILSIGTLLVLATILSPLGGFLSQLYEHTTNPRPGAPSTEIAGINVYSSGRLEKQWVMALSYWRERPLTGIGFDQVNLRRWFGVSPVEGGLTAHNLYLGWLAESGIIGFTAGLWFFYRITKSLTQARRSEFASNLTREITSGLWVFWISFMVSAIFSEFFWVSTWLFGFMMLLAACLTLISRRKLIDASRII